MKATVVRRPDNLKENRKLLSPPVIEEPLYQCAVSVTVTAYEPNATIEVDVNGTVTAAPGGFPFPNGVTIALPAPLVAGQKVKARQKTASAASPWTAAITVGDHTKDYPSGPPRPEINPAPVFKCGVRTGVGNLLPGGHVWITADGSKVGDVNGCAAQQGINVTPAYSLNQHAIAHYELCHDQSPPSVESIAGNPPNPPPMLTIDPVFAGGQSVTVRNVVNGAKVTLYRGGANQGTWPCWGGSIVLNGLAPTFGAGEIFTATQQMCPGDPPSNPGTGTVQPCSSLPAPQIGPVQGGDTRIIVVSCLPDAIVKVFVNGVEVGASGPPVVNLSTTLKKGDTVIVVQDLAGCKGQSALQVKVACVDPPVGQDPSALDLFPVGFTEYNQGTTHGSIYYPAEEDGKDKPFRKRVAAQGLVPIVVMAHGNHDPNTPSYLGYDYFQHDLAKMGIIAVSVDCNALNGSSGGVGNIVDRADLIVDNIAFLQTLDADPTSIFFHTIDFGKLGLMGHSRGGDAVVTVPTLIALAGVTIRSVLALAPTNFRYWAGMSTIQPKGYAFQTILPAGDGDVTDNNGAQFYDQATPDPFKNQLYVWYACHNFFNRQWPDDDSLFTPPQPAVMARSDHERVLSVYGSAFFRATLLGHNTTGYLSGDVLPYGALTSNVFRGYERSKALTVDNFDDDNTINTNSLGQPNTQTGSINAGEFRFDRPPVPPAFNTSFYGLTEGMVANPRKAGGIFRSQLKKPMDMTKREIWIRCAEVTDGSSVAASGTGFQLGLEDANGGKAWADCDDVGGLYRPYPRNPGMIKTMLSTLRFRGACFSGREFELKNVAAILVKCDRKEPRAIAFDDLQVY
jgi:hypothetical protein